MPKKRMNRQRKSSLSLRKALPPKDFSSHTIILFFVALVIVSIISSILYIQTLDKVAAKPKKTSSSQNFHLEIVNDAALKPPRQTSSTQEEEFISLQIKNPKTKN